MIQWQAIKPKPDIHIRKAALKRFLMRRPNHLDTRLKLADQHLYLGEVDHAWNLLTEVQDQAGANTDWLNCYGKTARALGEDEVAEDSLTAAWRGGSKTAGAQLAKYFGDKNRHDEAATLSKMILDANPDDSAAAMVYCKSLIATGQKDVLWEWAQACLQQQRFGAIVPSALAYASADQRQAQMMEALVETDRNLSCMRDFTGGASSAALRERMLTHKARSDFPTIYAAKGEGKRIDRLLDLGIDEVDRLFAHIKEAVQQYGPNVANPLAADIPKAASIESWANICTGNGHEDWHCHPAGWLSGVYYLDVPEMSESGAASAPEKAGQIEFGPLMLGKHNDLDAWPKMSIKPEKDMLLLFPSYFGHRTYPTQLSEPRISIAFDIVPAAA